MKIEKRIWHENNEWKEISLFEYFDNRVLYDNEDMVDDVRDLKKQIQFLSRILIEKGIIGFKDIDKEFGSNFSEDIRINGK